MDKYDFIRELEKELSGLSEEERNSAVSYYKELFEDAGSDREQELINNLGSPADIAESIRRESGTVAVHEKSGNTGGSSCSGAESESSGENSAPRTESKRDAGTALLLTAVLLLTSPVWLPVLISIYAVIITILVTVFIIAFVFGIIGIAGIIIGISSLFAVPPVGLVVLGLGLLFTALTLICAPFLCKGIFHICRAIINATVGIFHRIFYKKGAAA